jgi:hypothetical protein
MSRAQPSCMSPGLDSPIRTRPGLASPSAPAPSWHPPSSSASPAPAPGRLTGLPSPTRTCWLSSLMALTPGSPAPPDPPRARRPYLHIPVCSDHTPDLPRACRLTCICRGHADFIYNAPGPSTLSAPASSSPTLHFIFTRLGCPGLAS